MKIIQPTYIGQLVNDTSYARDRLGNILSQTDDVQGCTNVAGAGCAGATTNALGQITGTTVFSYDPENRLKTADYPGSAFDESFSYDKVGNRKTHTLNGTTQYYNVDAGNRLKDIRTGSPTGTIYESYQYDDNGSLTTVSGNRSMTLSWDVNNRVKQINTSQYRYDPSGYRIEKTAGITNRYYLEGEHLEAVYDGNGALRDQYMRGTVIDEVVNGYHRDANNMMVNSTYHHDALQSVLGQSAHDGQIQATQSYTAFGGNLSGTGTSNASQKYTGWEADGESGFYYYRARYYDPVNGNDPSGNCPMCVGAATSVVLGGAIRFATGRDVFDANAIATDAALGAAGSGIISKATQLYQTRYIAAPLSTKLAASSGATAQAQITSGIYFFEQGGASYVGQSSQIGTRLAAHVANPIKPISSVDNAVRAAVNGSKASREVAEQLTLNNMGGINALGVLNAINPIGAARIGLLNNSRLGTITSIATPAQSIWNSIFSGSAIGLSTNISSGANGGFVLYPNKSNTNMMQSVYQK
ncbi:MAG: hypothetical protein M0R33_24195 [Methylomonas sp.]|jgi:hypothetical protein|uniref:RHS repeat domain-containing protein n=1 Tax=Methylomonas sp. TaxID=418 RepID=UPI00260068EC|nr:hypothetical protein [Methylomonas sp.]MCK9609542.1 hypothetical protein [Methylomonas sp.]